MTKEQLIALIQNTIPDGDLVNVRVSKDEVYNIVGIDDDSDVGLWNLIISPIKDDEIPYDAAYENSQMWEKAGLK